MSEPKPRSRPERVLLLLARQGGDCRGKAIRFLDQEEFRFNSLEELGRWLMRSAAASSSGQTGSPSPGNPGEDDADSA